MAQGSPLRDVKKDHLLTPSNSVIAFIDYQPEQFMGTGSRNRDELMLNVLALGRTARDFKIPTVLTTVAVEMGANQATVPELRELLSDSPEIDRTTMNSWEDEDFVGAIKKTGRKKIIFAGLWTEVCVAFPALDAIQEGYDVYFVEDAIAGVSKDAHDSAVTRMVQAGAHPITTLALACELQRDWARGHGNTLRSIFQWYFPAMRRLRKHE
jgi:nicotinamidase-related amidase